jgi:hypothetical protein
VAPVLETVLENAADSEGEGETGLNTNGDGAT